MISKSTGRWYAIFMLDTILAWFAGKKTLPLESEGEEVFAYFKLPAPIVSWAMSRRRQEDPADLETLWVECLRADWLLLICVGVGVSEDKVRQASTELLGKESGSVGTLEHSIGLVTVMINELVANDEDLGSLEREVRTDFSYAGEHGMTDEEFEHGHEIELAIASIHRPFCERVRGVIPYSTIRSAINAFDDSKNKS